MHGFYIRYASRQNLYISKVCTNSGKQTVAYTVAILWDDIATLLRDLTNFNFLKHLKLYLCLNNILKTSYLYMLLFSNFMHILHSFNRNIITGGMLTRKPVVSLVSRLILYIFFSLSSHFTIIITCKCTKVTVDRTKINENCYKFVSVSVECEKRSFSSRD